MTVSTIDRDRLVLVLLAFVVGLGWREWWRHATEKGEPLDEDSL